MKLVLASGSQRRRELLTMCGYDYEIIVSNADETIDENDPESFVRALSFRKAKDVFDRLFAAGRRDFAVIGSDTVVAFQKDGKASKSSSTSFRRTDTSRTTATVRTSIGCTKPSTRC